MRIEDIEYRARGRDMIGHLAIDDSSAGPRPGVLVCHEGPGLDDHAKGRAERLAHLGYAAFALDYHGGGTRMPRDQMMERIGALTPTLIRSGPSAPQASTSSSPKRKSTRPA